jgi:Tfp pilus assembly protein PilW
MMHRTRGVTIVELLVAATVMILIMTLVIAIFGSTTRAYTVTATATESQAVIEATKQLLSYDLSLAGYRGTAFEHYTANAFTGSTVAIEKAATTSESDRIALRYFEDRYGAGGAVETVVAYTHSGDSLLRSVNGGVAQVVTGGVGSLSASFILRDPADDLSPSNPAIGVVIRIAPMNRPELVHVIAFRNTQDASLTTVLAAK